VNLLSYRRLEERGKMNSTIRFLILSAAIIIPWAIINVAGFEIKVRIIVEHVGISDLGLSPSL